MREGIGIKEGWNEGREETKETRRKPGTCKRELM